MKKELSLLERFVEYIGIEGEKDYSIVNSCTITDKNGEQMFIFQMLDRIYVTIDNKPFAQYEESKYHDHATGKWVEYFAEVFE